MSWRDIYSYPDKAGRITWLAKVPSNSIYFAEPTVLKNFYRGIHTDTAVDNINFGRGYFQYKNTSLTEHLGIHAFWLESGSDSVEIELDYAKQSKMFVANLKSSMGSTALNTYINEHVETRTTYASDVDGDLYGFIKEILRDVQKAYYEYKRQYQNTTLEFELDYSDHIESVKQLCDTYGYRFVLGDSDTHGKEITIFDRQSRRGRDNKVSFVSAPFGLMQTDGDFEDVATILGWYAGSYASDPPVRFKSADDMFDFIKRFLELYKTVKDSVNERFDDLNALVESYS